MIHPDTTKKLIDEEMGHGLFATKKIPKGTITWVLDPIDRILSQKQMDTYEEKFRDILLTYSFRNNKGKYVFCWDNGRYINHSFNPTCCVTPYKFEIALRDIEEGEEITNDYGTLNIIEAFEPRFEGGPRTMVYPDDLLRYANTWDKKIAMAMEQFKHVEQPLYRFLNEKTRQRLEQICSGKKQLGSIRSCYYDPAKNLK